MMNDDELHDIVEPLLESMGIALVEMSAARHRGSVTLSLVLHKSGGVTLDDLTSAQKILRPRLELDIEREKLSVEISSPGLSRVFKSRREYELFTGEHVSLLVGDDWVQGKLVRYDGTDIVLETDSESGRGERRLKADSVRKGKLG